MYPTTVQLLLGGHLLNGHPNKLKAASNQSLDENFSIVFTSFKRSSLLCGRYILYPFLRVLLFNWRLTFILRYYVTGLIWPNLRSGVFLVWRRGELRKQTTPQHFYFPGKRNCKLPPSEHALKKMLERQNLFFLSVSVQKCGNKSCNRYIPGDSSQLRKLYMFLPHG